MSEDADSAAVVLMGYAYVMKAVQEFEQQLKSIAIYREDLPNGIGFDTAWRRVEKLMRKPLGGLGDALPADLQTHWQAVKRARNHLAHEFLYLWQFERHLGLRTDDEAASELLEYEARFSAWTAQLEPIAQRCLEERGISPADLEIDRDDLRRMILGGEPSGED